MSETRRWFACKGYPHRHGVYEIVAGKRATGMATTRAHPDRAPARAGPIAPPIWRNDPTTLATTIHRAWQPQRRIVVAREEGQGRVGPCGRHVSGAMTLLYYATASTTLATFQALSRDLTGILYLLCYTAII